jgi:hypothetical protein
MKKGLVYTAIALALVGSGCQNQQAKENAKALVSANDSLFHVSEGPYRFSLYLPKDLLINNAAELKMNSATGELHIAIGDNFHLVVFQEQKDLAALEAELKEDPLFTNKIVEREEDALVYQQVLPTGEAYFYHYARIADVSGTPFVVRSWSLGEYPMDGIQRMKHAAKSIHLNGKSV